MVLYQEEAATSGRAEISSASFAAMSLSIMCQLPKSLMALSFWLRISMSAMLKIAVTRKTARTMQTMVIRFWRLCIFAEMGTSSR